MNILVTGARGMVGTALVANLYNIKENKNRTRPDIIIDNIYINNLMYINLIFLIFYSIPKYSL